MDRHRWRRETERRGGARPVRGLLGGKDLAGRLVQNSVDRSIEAFESRASAVASLHSSFVLWISLVIRASDFANYLAGLSSCFVSGAGVGFTASSSAASDWKRFSSSSCGLFLSIHATAWSYHLRASSLWPSCQ